MKNKMDKLNKTCTSKGQVLNENEIKEHSLEADKKKAMKCFKYK